ncbi:MAG: SxtJ family membrane protein [Nitrospiraceae bacterium]
MALVHRNHEPTSKELRLFGAMLAAFSSLLGGLALYHVGSWTIPVMIWSAGLLLSAFYYAIPNVQVIVFQTWMAVVFPIGWLISHALLAVIYYFVMTPIGLILRVLWNRDLLQKKWDSSASTYWVAYRSHKDVQRYFQQF